MTHPAASQSDVLSEARAFFDEWVAHPEVRPPSSETVQARLREIALELDATGTYTHRFEELEFGARLAWKNSNRCIGRHLWRSLEVRDQRSLHQLPERESATSNALQSHINDAFRGGKIKSIVSVFAPRTPGKSDPVRMANHQLIRYAGFQTGTRHHRRPAFRRTNRAFHAGRLETKNTGPIHPVALAVLLERTTQSTARCFYRTS